MYIFSPHRHIDIDIDIDIRHSKLDAGKRYDKKVEPLSIRAYAIQKK